MNQTCDDCGQDYPGPVYYSFDPEACISTREWVQEGARVEPPTSTGSGNVTEDDLIPHGDDCTGNLCPACAGPFLNPDIEDDARRPAHQASPVPLDPKVPGGAIVCGVCGKAVRTWAGGLFPIHATL